MYGINNFNYSPTGKNLYSSSWQYNNGVDPNNKKHSLDEMLSLENNLSQEHENDDIDALFKDKIRFQKLSALQVLYLIGERETLRDKNINFIDSRIMSCQENLSRFHMMLGPMYSNKMDGLQEALLDLEKQVRDERITSWRDTLSLKLSILDKLKGYKDLKRQEDLLKDVA